MTTTLDTADRRHRAGHPLAHPRHRRRRGHRRRLRRRVLGLERSPAADRSSAPSRSPRRSSDLDLRGLADAGRARARSSSASPAPRSSPRWSPPACRRCSGSQWGVDTLLSGFVQGAAAELVFAFTLYRVWTFPVLAIAAVASAAAAWVHDWVLYYADARPDDPDRPRRRDGDLGRGHRGRRLGRCSIDRSSGPASSTDSRTDGRGRASALARPRRSPIAGADRPALAGDLVRASSRASVPARRRAVRIGQEHARPGARGPRPARDPGDGGRASLERRRPRDPRARPTGGASPRGSGSSSRIPAASSSWSGSRTTSRSGSRTAAGRRRRCGRGSRRRSPRSASAGSSAAGRSRLSGGQQQRLALAGVARAASPGCSSSTSRRRTSIRRARPRCFERARRASAVAATATIVLVEHRVDAAWPLADLVLALDADGRPIDVGPPTEVARALRRSGCAAAGIWLPGGDRRPPSTTRRVAVAAVATVGVDARRSRAAARPASGTSAARPVVARRRPGDPGRASGRAGRAERQRQVDAGAAARRAAPAGPRARSSSAAPTPPRLPAAELARRAGYVFQEPERQFLAETVAEEVGLGLDRPGARAGAGADAIDSRLPLEPFGTAQPVPALRRRAASPLARLRARPRPGVLVLDEPTFGQDRRGYEGLARHPRRAPGRRGVPDRRDPRRAVRRATSRPGVVELDEAGPDRVRDRPPSPTVGAA